jgi:N-acetyl sugar amidotransferase
MDTSDPDISFNVDGICNHCIQFDEIAEKSWFPDERGADKLVNLVTRIKKEGEGKKYDSILGLSGGIDSSYLALKAYEWKLRPLVVHVDAGWNSELAVANIEAILKHCDFDLHTHVVDWEEMRDLQLAYLRSGISNQDVPQDHIFFSTLRHFAASNHIRYFLSGGNLATEGIFPRSWLGSNLDSTNLKSIHRKYGRGKLKNYKTISFFEYYLWYPLVHKICEIRPLNYMPYDKSVALEELKEKIGYKPYKRKHGESLFTKFFQNYWLPEKFGFDKRKPHLSSLIASGQISRQSALDEMHKPLYDKHELEQDIAFFCKKLLITREEFDQLMEVPNSSYKDFPNWDLRYKLVKKCKNLVEALLGRKIKVPS